MTSSFQKAQIIQSGTGTPYKKKKPPPGGKRGIGATARPASKRRSSELVRQSDRFLSSCVSCPHHEVWKKNLPIYWTLFRRNSLLVLWPFFFLSFFFPSFLCCVINQSNLLFFFSLFVKQNTNTNTTGGEKGETFFFFFGKI